MAISAPAVASRNGEGFIAVAAADDDDDDDAVVVVCRANDLQAAPNDRLVRS